MKLESWQEKKMYFRNVLILTEAEFAKFLNDIEIEKSSA